MHGRHEEDTIEEQWKPHVKGTILNPPYASQNMNLKIITNTGQLYKI